MEQFRGSLASYRLSLLIPPLFEGKRLSTGVIRVHRGATRREFFVQDGKVIAATSNEPHEHLAQVLVNLKMLDPARAASAFEAANTGGQPLGAFLIERGFLEPARLLEALAHKARETFFDCYEWDSGEVEFSPGLPELSRGAELRLQLGPLHRDAMARLREWRAFREVFPRMDARFRVFGEVAVEWASEEESELLDRLAAGATLGEALDGSSEGRIAAARRVLTLFRRGAIAVEDDGGPRIGESIGVGQLLGLARRFLDEKDYEHAAALALQVLERAPVPEAHALYRAAEEGHAAEVRRTVEELEGRLQFEALPRQLPSPLTSDDLYLYSRLKSARSVSDGLRGAAMGELGAYRSLKRLIATGLLKLKPAPLLRSVSP